MEITKSEAKLLTRLLDVASDIFSNHGCNDFEVENTEDNREIVYSAESYSDSHCEGLNISADETTIYAVDWIMMNHFCRKFYEGSKEV